MTTVLEELELILEKHDGLLFPKDVVEYARDPDTALHQKFNWDDTTAAELYRLWQARKIITVNVTVLKRDDISVNTFVSLKADRYKQGEDGEFTGGYRSMVDVLSTPSLRKTLLEEALEEHDFWEKKYQHVVELAEIFQAAKTVKEKRALLPAQKITA